MVLKLPENGAAWTSKDIAGRRGANGLRGVVFSGHGSLHYLLGSFSPSREWVQFQNLRLKRASRRPRVLTPISDIRLKIKDRGVAQPGLARHLGVVEVASSNLVAPIFLALRPKK